MLPEIEYLLVESWVCVRENLFELKANYFIPMSLLLK